MSPPKDAFKILVMNYSAVVPSLSSSYEYSEVNSQTKDFSQSMEPKHILDFSTTTTTFLLNGTAAMSLASSAITDMVGTTDPPSASEERPFVATILIALVLSTIVVLTITGNVLVIASVALHSNLRTTTNYFIANLAIADLLLGTTVLPFSATWEVLQYWLFGQIFCDIWAAIDVLCCTASILSLCVIGIDRYIGVTRPLQHAHIMRHARAVYAIVCVWLLSLIISVAPLVGWKEAPHPDPRVCTVTTQPGYVLFSVAGSFYIPCLIILVVYFRIYQETVKYTRCLKAGAKTAKVDQENVVSLRIHTGRNVNNANNGGVGGKQQQQCAYNQTYQQADSSVGSVNEAIENYAFYDLNTGMNGSSLHFGHGNGSTAGAGTQLPGGAANKKGRFSAGSGVRNSRLTLSNKIAKFKREKKAAKTLGIVVGVFITCWLPFFIILPLDSLCPDCYVPPLLFKLFFWLGYCNSTMNPIIYTCSSREFRRAFLSTLCCTRCRRRPGTPISGIPLRARNFDNPHFRAVSKQHNSKGGSVDRRGEEDNIMLDLSLSKKSNSSGSSTFNATSIDHKSSCSGSPTPPMDVVESAMSNVGQSAEKLPMIPFRQSLSYSSSDIGRLQNVALEAFGEESMADIDHCVRNGESIVPTSSEFEMKELIRDGRNSTSNFEYHKHISAERNSSLDDIESLIGDDSRNKQTSKVSPQGLYASYDKEIYHDSLCRSVSSAGACAPTYGGVATVDSDSTPCLVPGSLNVSNGTTLFDDTYSLAETISCSD